LALWALFIVLISTLLSGLVIALVTGLGAFFQHFTLRFWLRRADGLPWNLVAFLDEAAALLLLRKVGGGYIFVHRLLLEYFASLDTTPTPDAVRAKKEQV
jgi:eukaryotic-like serine/threonine-protein kinase